MKNLIICLTISTLAFISCESETEASEESNETVTDTTEKVEIEVIIDEAPLTAFVPVSPDTTALKKIWFSDDYTETLGYLYLSTHYPSSNEKDSVEYYNFDEEMICAFYQSFDQGIEYSEHGCAEEGGYQEKYVFPKMDDLVAKEFVNHLFFDPWNTWTSDYSYEAEGAGCYYNIQQSDTTTTIFIWCGC